MNTSWTLDEGMSKQQQIETSISKDQSSHIVFPELLELHWLFSMSNKMVSHGRMTENLQFLEIYDTRVFHDKEI